MSAPVRRRLPAVALPRVDHAARARAAVRDLLIALDADLLASATGGRLWALEAALPAMRSVLLDPTEDEIVQVVTTVVPVLKRTRRRRLAFMPADGWARGLAGMPAEAALAALRPAAELLVSYADLGTGHLFHHRASGHVFVFATTGLHPGSTEPRDIGVYEITSLEGTPYRVVRSPDSALELAASIRFGRLVLVDQHSVPVVIADARGCDRDGDWTVCEHRQLLRALSGPRLRGG